MHLPEKNNLLSLKGSQPDASRVQLVEELRPVENDPRR
jgi:hypothetical protein